MLGRRTATLPATLYTRRECPLCDRLERDLVDARLKPRPELRKVDVDADPALLARFGDWVPVLEVDGTILVRGAWSVAELARRWTALADGRGTGTC